MAIVTPPGSAVLTYEAYLQEGTINRRYDIIDGVRIFMSSPNWRHQRIQFYITRSLNNFEIASGIGHVVSAPFDVLIRRDPLRTRQPDVLFITRERLAQGGGIPELGVLEVAPEIVVEILSDSETRQRVESKIADYIAIGVAECWLVRPDARAVEILRLSSGSRETVAVYGENEMLRSAALPDLTLPVADFFRE